MGLIKIKWKGLILLHNFFYANKGNIILTINFRSMATNNTLLHQHQQSVYIRSFIFIFSSVCSHKFYFSLYSSLLRFSLFYFNLTNLLYSSSLSMALNSAIDCCILILKFLVSFNIAFSLFSLHFLMEIKSSLQYLVNMNIYDNFSRTSSLETYS